MLDTSLKSDYLRKADIVESVDKSTLAARRSFSFSALDHDPYVDGVVIRRPFEQNERKLDGRTIEWSMSPVGKVTISIVLKDDRRVETGVFDYATIFLALRYAADGRMLTTTVLNTEIPGVQNVLLRPALVDTQLGCEIVQLDNFIFSYVGADARSEVHEATRRVKLLDSLYRYSQWVAIVGNQDDPDDEKTRAEAFDDYHRARPSSEDLYAQAAGACHRFCVQGITCTERSMYATQTESCD
ncbi:hypothetical protein [Caballeronia sp. S22]|uniref:hypothetical protein n=1 Tax=Caballeronia sp. S22 TaxID=3137182 RepID=UPI0035315A6D